MKSFTEKIRVWGLVVAILVALAAVAAGQSSTPTVQVGQSFEVAWDYAAAPGSTPAEGFRLELNGQQVGGDIALGVNQVTVPAIVACGSNSIRVGSFAGTLVAWSASVPFAVTGCPPTAPSNLRIIISITQAANGTFNLKVDNVEVK